MLDCVGSTEADLLLEAQALGRLTAALGAPASGLMVIGATARNILSVGLFGLCHMSLTTIITTKLIAASDDAYRGRVMGVFSMAAIGAYPINSLIAGVLAAWVGPTNTVMLCGVALLASNLAFYGLGSMAIVNAGTGRAAATVADR